MKLQNKRTNKKILLPEITKEQRREKIIHQIAMGFLIAAGLIYSVSFFGYFVVPNSDFLAFLHTGQQWLHFQIPSMKRAPVFSIITALAGLPFSRPDRYLVGIQLFNALLLPVVMVLIYLNCRKLNLSGAVWIALAAGISPWIVRQSSRGFGRTNAGNFFCGDGSVCEGTYKTGVFFCCFGINQQMGYGRLNPSGRGSAPGAAARPTGAAAAPPPARARTAPAGSARRGASGGRPRR